MFARECFPAAIADVSLTSGGSEMKLNGKTKLAVALLTLGLVIGTCLGYGILRIPQPRLVFDLMMLLTFISMLIWTIRKRRVNEKDPAEGVR